MKIRGRTVLVKKRWHATAWIVGLCAETRRIDPIGFTDRSKARLRIERVRETVRQCGVEVWP